jgi:hypothetical protein
MEWNDRLVREYELVPHLSNEFDHSLAARARALIEHQRAHWPLLREGYDAFARVETKRIDAGESFVIVQHNPRRVASTAAAVDKASVEARGCFLCPSSLPADEKGISYGQVVLLCNPFPVLEGHLSIVHRDHIEQKIEGHVELLLALAADLSPDYFVLYNGPACGASAPDHLHFQACRRSLLPIETTIRAGEPQTEALCAACEESARQTFEVFTVSDFGRSVIVFRGADPRELAQWAYTALGQLPLPPASAEPLVNLICTHDRGQWTVYLFPRKRHRPACFYAEGDGQLLVSPGAIDMAGVIVAPERRHFEKIGREQVEQVFSEVSLSEQEVNEVTERTCSAMGVEEIG